MSESISTPTGPDIAAPVAPGAAPAPALAEPLSLSEAGRLLARRRVEAAQGAQGGQGGQSPPGSPGVHGNGSASGAPAAAQPSSYDVLAAALGLPESGGNGADSAESGTNGAPAPIAGIEIDGQHYTQEALRSALRQSADYTQKTQALAEQQRGLQSQLEALSTVLPYIKPELDALQGRLREAQMPDPSLIETNPQEFLRQQAAWQRTLADQQRLGQIEALNRQTTERMRASQVQAGNQALAEKYPFWRDEGQRAQIQKDIKDWAVNKAGFSERELAGLADHRQVEVLMRAMMWDRMTDGARTTAPRTNGVAPARGMAPPPAPTESVARAESRFGDAPNIRNAAALLSAKRAAERYNSR